MNKLTLRGKAFLPLLLTLAVAGGFLAGIAPASRADTLPTSSEPGTVTDPGDTGGGSPCTSAALGHCSPCYDGLVSSWNCCSTPSSGKCCQYTCTRRICDDSPEACCIPQYGRTFLSMSSSSSCVDKPGNGSCSPLVVENPTDPTQPGGGV